MGQGYSAVTLPSGLNPTDNSEIADLIVEKSLGGARFLRTARARHQSGIVVVKICTKANQAVSFRDYAKKLREQRQSLRGIPNVLAYQRIRESNTLGVLVRQFIHNSLYDRISIRPFLEGIEKKWIAFQLLCAVRDCHSRGVFHGDIKSENVLITSWGWVYLTDFASAYKPVYLPEDNPADFSFYYDTSARRTCYLAPERFTTPGEQPREGTVVQWNMDMFSVGCVLAELFTEVPTFTLSQLFRYRKGEYDPTLQLLSKVDDENIRNLITSMLRLDPGERWHAQDYLDEYKGKAFPLYFYNHLHTLMEEITDPTSGRSVAASNEVNNGVADDRIDMIYQDYERLSVSLGHGFAHTRQSTSKLTGPDFGELFPLQVDLPNSRHAAQAFKPNNVDNGTFILLNVVTASIRSAARSASKIKGCELLLAFAETLPDEAKLDRVLPYVIALLEDNNETVLVAALRTMTQLLALVRVVSPVNTLLFPQYIFPKLQIFIKTDGFIHNPLVRATYAASLASLAQTASRFLDIMQALRADGALPSHTQGADADADDYAAYHDAYDSTRFDILDQFEAQTKVFLTDTDNSVRRAFLTSVSSLCVFFGEVRASDVLLTHLNTYLNDPDWLLKCAVFRTMIGVAVYIGGPSLEEFILPLMLQALTDPQEFVVEQALRSMGTMAEMGLLQRAKIWELIDVVARFLVHPNLWIKEAAAHFVSAATTYLSSADIRILSAPLVHPYLKVPINTLGETDLLDALNKPVSRPVLDMALQWAGKAEKGIFWKPAKESRQLFHRSVNQMPPRSSVADLGPKSLARAPKTVEDESWLGLLRSAGMRPEDEMKILALREYLWRTAQRMKRDDASDSYSIYDQIVSLSKLNITAQTIIFEKDFQAYEKRAEAQDQTIAEALREASSPVITADAKTDNGASHVNTTNTTMGPRLELPEAIQGSAHPLGDTTIAASLSSSPASIAGPLAKDGSRAPRYKASATGLFAASRGGPNKAQPDVATDDQTAVGHLDVPSNPATRRSSPGPGSGDANPDQASRNPPVHNYTGSDPTVIRLLDAVYVERYPLDIAEFGPLVQYRPGSISTSSTQTTASPWRPNGNLVAILGEHTAKITSVLPAPDHSFFLTASEDGSIKVWDAARLERNVTHRSRQTYRLAPGVRVTSLCFIQATYSFICTGSDGSVHAVKVEASETNSGVKYGKLRAVREWHIPAKFGVAEYATCSDHFRGEAGSTLVLATNLGRILVLDLKYMSITYEMRVAASHGEPTAFCVGRKHDWLLVGTSHGVLELWDLRFQLLLKTVAFASAEPITRLNLHPSRNSSRRNKFCVTGGTGRGEVSIWDVEKFICNNVYRIASSDNRDRVWLEDYELRSMDDDKDKPNSLLNRVTSAASRDNSHNNHTAMVSSIGIQLPSKDRDRDHAFIITGGPDNKVRFWDCERVESCCLVNGGTPNEKPNYTLSHSGQRGLDLAIFTEKAADDDRALGGAVESNKISPASRRSGKESTALPQSVPPKPTSRYETIRLSAMNLLSGHLDTVTDVAVLERPFGMVLSADRSGRVFVYQ
jgi:phosphoinositide-3-kinase regulatory subunit 4